MAKEAPITSSTIGREHRRKLRFHQTPIRRSPRFLNQKEEEHGQEETITDLKTPDPRSMPSFEKTPQRCSTKCLTKPSRRSARLASNAANGSVEAQKGPVEESDKKGKAKPRRSPRLASIPTEVTEGRELAVGVLKENVAIGRSRVRSVGVKECQRRSVRLMDSSKVSEEAKPPDSAKVLEKVETGVSAQTKRVRRDRKAKLEISKESKRMKTEKICKEKIERKERQLEEDTDCEGWTKEQQAALHKAYFVAKPSPHFWKKVSKMVPGKSAQECFDRVNGSLQTPPQPQPRSRSCRANFSPIGSFSLPADKSTQPAVPRTRRLSSRKKTLVAQKTVRHLLKKHCLIDQTHEADYFSVLEDSSNTPFTSFPEIRSPETPNCVPNNPSFLQKCSSRSSAHRKMLSRFKPSSEANGPSPQVLKKIKNVVLHEKYIDRLHCREARRKFAKTASTVSAKDGEVRSVVLKAAKTALISEARDVISEFQHMQTNSFGNVDIDDDEYDVDHDDQDASGAE